MFEIAYLTTCNLKNAAALNEVKSHILKDEIFEIVYLTITYTDLKKLMA